MEIVEIKNQVLLAGSAFNLNDSSFDAGSEILAPDLDVTDGDELSFDLDELSL